MSRGRRRRARPGRGRGEDGSGERWLLTYADMITLLMALFMVLFSISAVNVSKYRTLKESLRAAFSGKVLPGGKSIAQPGSSSQSSHVPAQTDVPSIMLTSGASIREQEAAQNSQFEQLKRRIEAYAARHGLRSQVKVAVEAQGLVIRVLTDKVLFASGEATLQSRSHPLLDEIAHILNLDLSHPIAVEGNTDDVPIHSSIYPSNWELSAARASTVVRYLIGRRVAAERLSAIGYGDEHPLDSNATAAGRAKNRRVEIVLQRTRTTAAGTGSTSGQSPASTQRSGQPADQHGEAPATGTP